MYRNQLFWTAPEKKRASRTGATLAAGLLELDHFLRSRFFSESNIILSGKSNIL